MVRKIEARDLSETFPSVVLFREDIEEVAGIIERATGEPPIIISGNSEYDSLDELQRLQGTTLRNLRLRSIGDAMISFEFSEGVYGHHFSIFLLKSDKTKAALTEIREIVLKRKRWFSFLKEVALRWFVLFSSVGMVLLLVVVVLLLGEVEGWRVAAIFGVFWGWVFAMALWLVAQFGGLSRVYLERFHERRGFWQRHKDKIVPYTICAFIGGFIVLGFEFLYDWITSYFR